MGTIVSSERVPYSFAVRVGWKTRTRKTRTVRAVAFFFLSFFLFLLGFFFPFCFFFFFKGAQVEPLVIVSGGRSRRISLLEN